MRPEDFTFNHLDELSREDEDGSLEGLELAQEPGVRRDEDILNKPEIYIICMYIEMDR